MQEVFKYALKFSDLSIERQFEAYEILRSTRLIGSFGLLHGVKVPESLLDDLTDFENLPYNELSYSYNPKKSAYELKQNKLCKPATKAFEDIKVIDTDTGEIRCLYDREGRSSDSTTLSLNDDAGIKEREGSGGRGGDPNDSSKMVYQALF